MSDLHLIPQDDPRLHVVSDEVTFPVDSEMISFIVQMEFFLVEQRAVGLAAPQVGVNKRIIIVDVDYPRSRQLLMINPVITRTGSRIVKEFREGCLSVPNTYVVKPRYDLVTVEYQNVSGVKHQQLFRGLTSICVQHEIDHLNGILITDKNGE